MAQLVQVPYQPECWLTPDTLALLQAVNARMGTNLQINGADGAWRPYARQAYLYNGYIKGLPGFNTASNPDTGQRNHMRGAAFDLVRTDAAVQAACRAVGLIRDSAESWHWNNPNWANMPIIPDLPGVSIAADGTVTPITGGFLMALTDAEQAELLNGVRNLYSGFFAGGPSMPDGGKALVQTVADLRALISQLSLTAKEKADLLNGVRNLYAGTFAGGPSMEDGGKSISRSLAEIHAGIGGAAGPAIDYDALGVAIVKAGGSAPTADSVAAAVVALLGSKLGA